MKKSFSIIVSILVGILSGCTDYKSQIDEIQAQISTLQSSCGDLSSSIQSFQSLVEQLEKESKVAVLTPVGSGSSIAGYVVTFDNGESVTVYNNSFNIGVGQEGGRYYWMADGKFIEKDGRKIEISKETVPPLFKIENDCLMFSTDNGAGWSTAGAVGRPCIESVTEDGSSVKFTLAGGSDIVIPKDEKHTLAIKFYKENDIYAMEDNEVVYELTGAGDNPQLAVYVPEGWRYSIDSSDKTTGYININPGNFVDYEKLYSVYVFVADGKGQAIIAEMQFTGYEDEVLAAVPCEDGNEGDGTKSAVTGARVGAAGGKVAVKINTNLEYTAETDADWLVYNPTKSVRTESLQFTAAPNPDQFARTALVTVKAGNYKVLTRVIQEPAAGGTDPSEDVPAVVENTFPIYGYNSLTAQNSTVENFRKLEEAGFTASQSGLCSKGVQKEDRYFPDFYGDPSIEKIDKVMEAAAQTGVKVVLPMGSYAYDREGLHHIMPDGTTKIGFRDVVNRYKDNPALWGYQILDEPTSPEDMEHIRSLMDDILEIDPDHRFFTALLACSGWYTPSMGQGGIWDEVEGYLNGWCDIVHPTDMFNTDCYPVRYTTRPGSWTVTREWEEGDEEFILQVWYEGLAADLKVAQERNLDFWGYTATSRFSKEPAEPTYEGLLLQVNTILAYGGHGIVHFTVEAWNIDCYTAPFMEDGTTTDCYDQVKAVNLMVQRRAGIFLHSDVKWLRHTKGTNRKALKWWRGAQDEIPARNTQFADSDLAGDVVTSLSTDITAIVSRFSSDGVEYLMIQSKDHTVCTDVTFTNTATVYEVDKEARLHPVGAGRHVYTIGKGDCLLLRLTPKEN